MKKYRQYSQFHLLRNQQLELATKQFNARGASVDRCDYCLLAKRVCICRYAPRLESRADIILLFHREELFKPTNTGRLLMDALPRNTFGFCWSRTEPEEALLKLINDPVRLCLIVFPFDETLPQYDGRRCYLDVPRDDRRVTFILLDGTWKQAGRMFHLSKWMGHLNSVVLSGNLEKQYQVRKSHEDHYVSTFEAGVACLEKMGASVETDLLRDYFNVFNEHYLALRGCREPLETVSHHKLRALSDTFCG